MPKIKVSVPASERGSDTNRSYGLGSTQKQTFSYREMDQLPAYLLKYQTKTTPSANSDKPENLYNRVGKFVEKQKITSNLVNLQQSGSELTEADLLQVDERSPANFCFEDGPFELYKHKVKFDGYLKMKVYDMAYEGLKWRTLHSSMLKNCSKSIDAHKRLNRYSSVWCHDKHNLKTHCAQKYIRKHFKAHTGRPNSRAI